MNSELNVSLSFEYGLDDDEDDDDDGGGSWDLPQECRLESTDRQKAATKSCCRTSSHGCGGFDGGRHYQYVKTAGVISSSCRVGRVTGTASKSPGKSDSTHDHRPPISRSLIAHVCLSVCSTVVIAVRHSPGRFSVSSSSSLPSNIDIDNANSVAQIARNRLPHVFMFLKQKNDNSCRPVQNITYYKRIAKIICLQFCLNTIANALTETATYSA